MMKFKTNFFQWNYVLQIGVANYTLMMEINEISSYLPLERNLKLLNNSELMQEIIK